jgi:hypothetical protein
MTRRQLRPIPAWLPSGSELELLELQQMEDRLRRWGDSPRRLPWPVVLPDEPWRI